MATQRSYNQTVVCNELNGAEGASKVITFNGAPVECPGFCGTVSSISWGNPATMSALRQMFDCKPDEVIVAIEITNDGIRAKFELDLT